ncbi:CPBP family intramembrane glutamic endopeptidase [Tautonia plasticadhaerens]|uniref:CAAX amino terminal protease self-immunity n=1 Tax=Tautonia plasticadhaerens TaxID=2527974 RepID=A0A518H7F2_9BACT|nr:CPBP family intramembrane glutamic endopeptidase [Tautonia plasticadhaerens]QDV36696.1 CAAX amino terminal protease self- immunity [Tautonia plasticadhaerens]
MRVGGGEDDEGPPGVGGNPRGRALAALLLLVPIQSLAVIALLFAFPGVEGKIFSGICRIWMLVLPLVWTRSVEGAPLDIRGPTRRGVGIGLAAGLALLAVILATYALVRPILDPGVLLARASSTGFDRPVSFVLVSAYVIFVNSLLEEYVWRWFVYRQVEAILPPGLGNAARRAMAVLVAAMLFTVHHVIALSAWVGPGAVLLGSVGVFLGALIWSAIYARERSLWPCYFSHILADLAIMIIGYDVIFRSGG